MIWKKAVLVLTFIFALILGIVSVYPSGVAELQEPANLRLSASAKVPFKHSFPLKGLAVSGTWEGSGRALVWVVGEGKRYLVLDTDSIPDVLEFSFFGSRFENACVDSCSMPALKAETLMVYVSGPGFLTIDSYNMAVPLDATGLALCPNCQRINQTPAPDHFLLSLVLLLVIAVAGSHVLGHYVESVKKKRVLLLIFLSGFLLLGGVFGLALAAPNSNVVLFAKQTASIISAVFMIVLFGIIGVEILAHKQDLSKTDVWKDLEEAEEKWETK